MRAADFYALPQASLPQDERKLRQLIDRRSDSQTDTPQSPFTSGV